MNSNKQVFIFTHIPKTAGTSLRYHFQKYLEDQLSFIHLANKGNKQALSKGLLPFRERPESDRNNAQVLLGHDVNMHTAELIPSKTPCEIVYFRDPVDWEISRYNQYAHAKSFRSLPYLNYSDWTQFEKTRSQFDWFLKNYGLFDSSKLESIDKLETLNQLLSKFYHVGFVENINQDMIPIFEKLEIPINMKSENVTGKYEKQNLFKMNDEPIELVSAQCSNEIELYLKIKKIFDRNFL